MTAFRPTFSAPLFFTLILLQAGPALGQFRRTSTVPGFIWETGSNGSGPGQFSGASGVATDGGNIYVVDTGNDRIQKFARTGTYLFQWGSTGSGNGQFFLPTGIAVDNSGHIYVAEAVGRVQKFDRTGTYLSKWGSNGLLPGQFSSPQGLATDSSGRVYVADTGNDRIQKFSADGVYLAQWGSNGVGEGQFSVPNGVAIDASDNVYVADTGNDRIQKFDSEGNFLAQWGSSGSAPTQFSSPRSVATDRFGHVYVTDGDNNRVQRYDNAGVYLGWWGDLGSGEGQFDDPRGVATDDIGSIYVVDNGNVRLQRFAPRLWFGLSSHNSYLSVETLDETLAVRTLFQLENNGAPRFAFRNTDSDVEWSFQQSAPGNFLISLEGTGGPEMQFFQNGRVRMGPGGARNFDLDPSGNLGINGNMVADDYFYTSDRNTKHDFEPVDPEEILSQVTQLPISRWRFKDGKTPHIGPMGQDFYALFGVGQDDKHLSPTDTAGVALAAIQGLHRQLQDKDKEIQLLKARLSEIELLLTDR